MHDIPRFIPCVAVFIHQQPHQFRNTKRRMGIIDVDGDLICQIVQCPVQTEVVTKDVLTAG